VTKNRKSDEKGPAKAKRGAKHDGPFAGLGELRKKLEQEEAARVAAKSKPAAAARSRPAPANAPTGPSATFAPSTTFAGEDEALAFHRLMGGVTPLDRTRSRIPKSLASIEPGAARAQSVAGERATTRANDEVHEHLRALVEGGSRFEVSDDGRRVEGRRADVPAEWLRKIRRGLLPIDGRLDLHGLRAEDARAALDDFLRDKRAQGERCVLVIHGKGAHTSGGPEARETRTSSGILRGEIAAWLSQGRSSANVAAFATARDDDGGEGAVYVLLRR